MAHGSDPNETDTGGLTPLHYCGRLADHESMARLLLSKGADPNRLDKDGFNCAYLQKNAVTSRFYESRIYQKLKLQVWKIWSPGY